jgi:hypothetical protein
VNENIKKAGIRKVIETQADTIKINPDTGIATINVSHLAQATHTVTTRRSITVVPLDIGQALQSILK